MSLTKVNYIDNSTIITAQNLNDIQDNIIQNSELVKKVALRNLLDNSDFRNPVNQRGQTSYTGVRYTIDRWILAGNAGEQNTMQISEDGYISLSGSDTINNVWLAQIIPSNIIPTGNKATFAVKQNGVEDPYILNIDAWGTNKIVNFDNGISLLQQNNEVVIYNGSGIQQNFNWAALYEGEYTTETLPEYQPKGYGVELAECRRYFQKISNRTVMYGTAVANASYASSLQYDPMRIIPTASLLIGQSTGCTTFQHSINAVNQITVAFLATDTVVDAIYEVELSADL